MDRPWEASAAILAGGRSSRFGSDKALALLDGRPLIEQILAQLDNAFAEVLISCDDTAKFSGLGVPVVADPVPGCGPLMGIASALGRARHERVFVVEQNRDAQMRSLLMTEAEIPGAKLIPALNYDGMPLTAAFVHGAILKRLQPAKAAAE